MTEKSLPILMTASISTRGMKGARYSDKDREIMYLETLSYYIRSVLPAINTRIVFAENSGWDLSYIRSQLELLPQYDSSRVEWLSIPIDYFDISRGKGYNEIILINEAIKKSVFINDANAFLKVTGRYPVLNLIKIFRSASIFISTKGLDFFCDTKDHQIYDMLGLNWCGHSVDARIFATSLSFYNENIANKYVELDDYKGKLLEHLLFRVIKEHNCQGINKRKGLSGGGRIKARFDREPIFGGKEGSQLDAFSFSDDQNSIKAKIKRCIGNLIRTLTPWIWF